MSDTISFKTRLARALLPRAVRNALRRPRVTLARLRAKLSGALGQRDEVELTPGCTVKCLPLCVEEFSVFTVDPEQRDEMAQLASLVRPGMQLMDVGTHWGAITLAAMKLGGSEARSVMIEASNEAARVLMENLRLNGVESQTVLVRAACGDKEGVLQMLTTGAGGADYFVVPSEARSDTIQVPQVTVDSVCAAQSFAPTHLKIDVEGFEEEVLRGSAQTLATAHPLVFLELHGDHIRRRHCRPEAVLELLEAAGYGVWTLTNGQRVDQDGLATLGYVARFVASRA